MTNVGGRLASVEPGQIANRAPREPSYSVIGRRFGLRGARLGLRRLVGQPELGEQAGQQGLVDAVGQVLRDLLGGRVAGQAQLLGELAKLGGEVLPLADAQEVEVLRGALLAEPVARELAALRADVLPEVQPRQEVRPGVGEPGVRGVGLGRLLGRPLAGVLGGEPGGDDGDLVQAAEPVGGEDHARDPRVHGQARERSADVGEPRRVVVDDRPELGQQPDAVADRPRLRRVDERELLDRPELRARHLQDHRREVGALDLRVGELGPRVEVVLGVEADADAVRDAPAPAGPLGGAGLGDLLDREALHLGPLAVARDAGQAGVDDVADAGHRQRGLGDVGGEDDPAPVRRPGLEDAVLLGRGEPGVEREHVERVGRAVGQRVQRVGGVADLALAGEEDQDVAARPLAPQLVDGLDDAVDLVLGLGSGLVGVGQRAVADLDGERATGDLDDRGVPEVLAEALGVDRRRGDDHLEVGAAGEQLREVPEQEVDVEAALVGLVDDQGVVAAQQPVLLDLGEQDAVGHELDQRVLARVAGEPHLVADDVAVLGPQLLGDPLGDRARRDPPRLRVPDGPGDAAAELQGDLGQLRRLARAGLPGDDDDLVALQGGLDVVDAGRDRQLLGVRDGGDRRAASLEALLGLLDVGRDPLQRPGPLALVGDPAGAVEPAGEPVRVGATEGADAGGQLVGVDGGCGHSGPGVERRSAARRGRALPPLSPVARPRSRGARERGSRTVDPQGAHRSRPGGRPIVITTCGTGHGSRRRG